jgi:hypothetical protein
MDRVSKIFGGAIEFLMHGRGSQVRIAGTI